MHTEKNSCSRLKISISVLVFIVIFVAILSVGALAQTKSNGDTCTSNSECQSGYCGGTCQATPTTTYQPSTTSTTYPSTTSTTYQSSTTTTSSLPNCGEGPISSSGCRCPGPSGPPYYTGYCCNNVYQASQACGSGSTTTTYSGSTSTTYTGGTGGFPNCNSGPITTTGCMCGIYYAAQTGGYCCNNVYQTSACGTTTTYYGSSTTYTSGGTKSDGSSCSLNNECYSNFCSGGVCKSSGPGYPSSTYTGGTYPSTTYQAPQCGSGTPWYCYTSDACKNAGANWCPPMSGGPYNCQSSPCQQYTGSTYAPQTTYQTCEQKSVTAIDAANHCSFYRSPCDVPPGWKIVDKCPEYKPPEGQRQQPGEGKYENVPQGCYQQPDGAGGSRVVCPQTNTCPTISQDQFDKCTKEGGTPNKFTDHSGCTVLQCQFQSSSDASGYGGGFTRPLACPQKSQIDSDADKCVKFGGKPVSKVISGCVVTDCLKESREGPKCPPGLLVPAERDRCEGSGGRLTQLFDEKGCQIEKCSKGVECDKVSQDAYTKCSDEGGQLTVRNDQRGCAEFVKCVKRGNSNDVEYEKVDEVPDSAKLLQMALKLETVKIEMDKLGNKTASIADYYQGTGNTKEQKRFERVTGMLAAAEDKIDEIKNTLAEKIKSGGVKTQHVSEFKHDLKYIKQVIFENILYVMLSADGADAKLVERTESAEAAAKGQTLACGPDGQCFDDNVRACNPSTFNPETFVNVKINGLTEDGKACSIRVEMTPPIPGQTKTYVADCKYDKYPFGMRGPDDLIPTCTGDGVDIMKKFGSEGSGGTGPSTRPAGGPQDQGEFAGGPGGCKSDQECRDYCYDHFDECKKFAQSHGFEKDLKQEYNRQAETYKQQGYPEVQQGGYGPPQGYGGYGAPGYGDTGAYKSGAANFPQSGYPAGGQFPEGNYPQGGYPQPPGGYPSGGQYPQQPQQPQYPQGQPPSGGAPPQGR